MNVIARLKGNYLLFLFYLIVIAIATTILFYFSGQDIYLYINKLNSPFFDAFFKYITILGTFAFIGPIILLLTFKSVKVAVTASLASLIAMLMTQLGKFVIWPDSPRPKVVFESLNNLHFVDGVRLNSSHSFPSGHTTGAFALLIVIALFSKKQYTKYICLFFAILVGYSRIYLSQHFLVDVTVGSLLGTVSALLCYLWIANPSNKPRPWLEKSFRLPLKK